MAAHSRKSAADGEAPSVLEEADERWPSVGGSNIRLPDETQLQFFQSCENSDARPERFTPERMSPSDSH